MNILFVGDSWAAGQTCDGTLGAFYTLLSIPKEFQHARPGSTAVEWGKEHWKDWVEPAIEQAAEADAVVISLLGNDLRQIVAEAKSEDLVASLSKIENSFYAMQAVERALHHPKQVVMLYADPWSGSATVAVSLLNGAIAGSSFPGCNYLDAFRLLKPEHFNGVDFHPNLAGYEVLAEEIKRLLQ